MHRRLLATVVITSFTLAGVVASAATLDITRATLVAGARAVESCERDGIDVDLGLAWRDHFAVAQVRVSGLDNRCVGHSLQAVLIVSGASVELQPVNVPSTRADDNVVVLAVPGDVDAVDIERIHIAIN